MLLHATRYLEYLTDDDEALVSKNRWNDVGDYRIVMAGDSNTQGRGSRTNPVAEDTVGNTATVSLMDALLQNRNKKCQ
jgi:hypothetical protein